MKITVEFLDALRQNNDRAWFETNKTQYKEAQEEFYAFVQQLIQGIATFDPAIAHLTPKDCVYRIYRDVRFSRNKEPYKTYMGAYMCAQGRKSEYAGYYFHVESTHANFQSGNLLAAGLYGAPNNVLQSVRQEIYDHTELFLQNLNNAPKFAMTDNAKLKKVPRSFPGDAVCADYLKYKDYSFYQKITDKQMLSKDFLSFAVEQYSHTAPFISQVNRAVEYALEEM